MTFVMALAFGGLFWRLSQGPVSLDFLDSKIAGTINAELSGARIDFAHTVMLWEKGGGVRLRLADIRVSDEKGEVLAGAPLAAISVSTWSALTGSMSVSRFELMQPVMSLRRNLSGGFSFGIADKPVGKPQTQPPPVAPPQSDQSGESLWLSMLAGGRLNLLEALGVAPDSALRHIGVRNATLVITDEAVGKVWRANNAELAFDRIKAGYTLFAEADFIIEDALSKITLTASIGGQGENASVKARFKDMVPADFAPLIPHSVIKGADVPLSGSADMVLNAEGRLVSAYADIESGAGLLAMPGGFEPLLIDEAAAKFVYTAETGAIRINSASVLSGINYARYSGKITPGWGDGGTIRSVSLELASQDLGLAFDEKAVQPFSFNKAGFKAFAVFDPFRIGIQSAVLSDGKASIRLSGMITEAPGSPEVRLAGSLENVKSGMLTGLWPGFAAAGIRTWVKENVKSGRITNAGLNIHLLPGEMEAARRGVPIPDSHINFRFGLSDVALRYIDGLPPLENGSGEGVLEGNRLSVKMSKGIIKSPSGGVATLTDGVFNIDAIHEDIILGFAMGHVNVHFRGEISPILEVLDMKPLEYISQMKLKPSAVKGAAEGTIKVSMPLIKDLPLKRVAISAAANLKKITIRKLLKDIDLSKGDVLLKVNEDELKVDGPIELNGVAANLKWRKNFKAPQGKSTSLFHLDGTLDEKGRKALNLDFSYFMSGPAPLKIVATGRRGSIENARIEAVLTKAVLKQDQILWRKKKGVPAKAVFNLDFRNKDFIRINKLKLTGKNMDVRGAMRISKKGRLLALDLGRVRLGSATDLTLSGKRTKKGVLDLKIKGKSFDARPVISDILSSSENGADKPSGSSEDGGEIALKGSLGAILGHNRVLLHKNQIELRASGDLLKTFSLKGRFDNERALSIRVTGPKEKTRRLRVSSADGGSVLRASDFYTRMSGGGLNLDALMQNVAGGGVMTGQIIIRDFRIIGDPALKQVLSSSKFQKQITDVSGDTAPTFTAPPKQVKAVKTSGDNVPFKKLKLAFKREKGVLSFSKGLIAGPVIGATARGKIDNKRRTLQVAGTLVPAYGFNAAFGKIPLIGRLLSGRKGEGVFGITFGIKGPAASPTITINPASVIAPGFLRMLFEFSSGTKTREPVVNPMEDR